jgi:hypothetical protein
MKHWRKICIGTLLTTSTALISLAGVGGSVNGAQYKYLMDISFNRAPGAPTLNNFPVLVVLNSDIPNFDYAQLKSNAEDLRFADDGGLELAYEIENWDTGGDSHIWVSVSTLSDTSTNITAYWGNPTDSTPSYTTNGSTWDSDYKAVWHMAEPDIADATSNANDGTSSGNSTTNGAIGSSQDLAGSAHVNIDTILGDISQTSLTLTALTRTSDPDGASGNGGTVYGYSIRNIRNSAVPEMSLVVGPPGSSGKASITEESTPVAAGISTVSNGQWHQLTYTRNEDTGTLYVDGVAEISHTATFAFESGDTWALGALPFGSGVKDQFVGQIDEARVSSVARSDGWIKASYETALDNSNFTTYGEVESTPVPGSVFFGW